MSNVQSMKKMQKIPKWVGIRVRIILINLFITINSQTASVWCVERGRKKKATPKKGKKAAGKKK